LIWPEAVALGLAGEEMFFSTSRSSAGDAVFLQHLRVAENLREKFPR